MRGKNIMGTIKSKAVDYALPASLTVRDAEREWKAAARSYVAGLKGDESRTVSAILATRTALKAGLIVAGSVQGKNLPDGAISRTKFAAQFCAPVVTPDGKAERGSQVTTTLVTFWERAAHCVDLGIVPGHPLWAIIVGRKAGRRNSEPVKVGDRIMAAKTIKAVETALQADGWDLKTGVRKTGPKVKAAKQTDDDSQETPEAKPLNAVQAAMAAAENLRTALEAIPVTSGKADAYKAIRDHVRLTLAGQDKARGILSAPAVQPVVEVKATPAAMPAKRTA